ncbi:MAG: hypothetical protein ACKOW8_03415 [Flavobacteriales bacterium]
MVQLSSCVRYGQPPSLTLSGEYRIDRITYERVDNASSQNLMIFNPGDLYINPFDKYPLDTVMVGFTRWHLDYSSIRFEALNNPDGSLTWSEPYFYDIHGQYGPDDLGYFVFNINGSRRVWQIVSDGLESIVFRTSGLWPQSSNGHNEQITLHLTRIGP